MIAGALEELDLTAVLGAFRDQEAHGHTAASDAEIPIGAFGNKHLRPAAELYDVLQPGKHYNLDVGYRRAARLAAIALATMRRIRVEQSQTRSTDQ